jgi:hypothetical protein
MDYTVNCDINPALSMAEQILIWKKHKITFYAEDIINMMVDAGLININDVYNLIEELKIKQVETKLPKPHLV